ncbi:MAG: RnfABCDGE type electron transport complex subunit B, partial [Acutalibacteraceae bacterium]|nr:RnfABCDGE type electron transport complex subunit B [Acutalibacteraceae bacterium]
MNPIILAVIIVAILGLVLGLLLAIASIVMAVPVDEKAVAIEEVLAGANCGACGYSGCAGYAAALAAGECEDTTLCSPGGSACAKAVAEIMGVAAGDSTPMTAVVLCHGTEANAGNIMDYHGDMSCKTAAQLFGGGKACSFGCLGLGDCEAACPFDAIHVGENGLAEVDSEKCRACKICINVCPKGVIELAPLYKHEAVVYCQNHNKGGETRKMCKVGCIGCMKCQKTCQHDAIHVENFKASVDYAKCVGCGDCATACPVGCIDMTTFGK